MHISATLGRATCAAAMLAVTAVPAAALDCGKPVVPSPDADAALAAAIPGSQVDGHSGLALGPAIDRLSKAGMPPALIVDHAVAAYCPMVERDQRLSAAGKREAVRRFAALVTDLAYGALDPNQAQTAILLTVPVDTALAERIDAAAIQSGQSRDAWLVEAIRAKLKGG
ncbi:hypothetical protein [Methylobacterium sp. A54F]